MPDTFKSAYLRRKERAARENRNMERCVRCGYVRINVIHETDREHAPEGLAYYADIPFCALRAALGEKA